MSVAVAIRTASTSGDEKMSAAVRITRAPVEAATASAAALLMSWTAARRARGVGGDIGGVHGADAAAAEHSDPDHRGSSLVVSAILVAFRHECQYTMRTKSLRAIRRGRKQHDRLDNSSHHGSGRGPLADAAVHRNRRRSRAPVRRRVRHLRARQRHLLLRSARGGAGSPADLARPERAVDGARRHRLRQSQAPSADHDRDDVDRPRRAQHGDRGGHGARQPPAGAADLRRHLHQPPAGPGHAAGRAFRRPDHHGQRRLQGGDALLGPHHPSRADHLVAAASRRHDARSGGLRAGVPGVAAGHAGTRLRLS